MRLNRPYFVLLSNFEAKSNTMPVTNVLLPKICEYCCKPFMAKTITTRFCSKECNNKCLKEKKKREEKEKKMLSILEARKEVIADIQTRPYVSVAEASKLFGISKDTIRRMVRKGAIPGMNLGLRLTRVDREQIERMFTSVVVPEEVEVVKIYEPDECYTIGECLKKYNLPECRLESIINGFKIPKRQIGNYVYIPKIEIDKIMNTKNGDKRQ